MQGNQRTAAELVANVAYENKIMLKIEMRSRKADEEDDAKLDDGDGDDDDDDDQNNSNNGSNC